MKSEKVIKIALLPIDFVDSEWVVGKDPLESAAKRHFNTKDVRGGYAGLVINDKYYLIQGACEDDQAWTETIYNNVKAAYAKDTKAQDAIYYVEIVEPLYVS